jgi:hypothetical protein
MKSSRAMKSAISKSAERRAAFTLVEVLLTSVLTATLLAALWSLLAMYSKMFDTGQTKTEQSQLARTLFAQLSDDLHSIIQAPPVVPPMPLLVAATPSGATTPGSSTSKSGPTPNSSTANGAQATNKSPISSPSGPAPPNSGNSATVAATNSQAAGASSAVNSSASSSTASSFGARRGAGRNAATATTSLRPAGLFGTESYLQIDVLQAAAVDLEADANHPQRADALPATRAAELRTVVYAFEELRDTTLTEPRMLLTRREMNWEMAHPAARGPAGRRGGQSRLPMPGQIGAKGLPADAILDGFDEASTMSVPEVMQFRLRYFDGNVWSTQWDSVALKRLPAAVEVAMHLRSFDEPDPVTVVPAEPIGEELGGVKPKLPVYRLVIQLPDTAAGGTTLPAGRGPRSNTARTLGANANARP